MVATFGNKVKQMAFGLSDAYATQSKRQTRSWIAFDNKILAHFKNANVKMFCQKLFSESDESHNLHSLCICANIASNIKRKFRFAFDLQYLTANNIAY